MFRMILAILVSIGTLSWGDVIKGHDGTERRVSGVTYRDGKVFAPGLVPLSREKVKEIFLESESAATVPNEKGTISRGVKRILALAHRMQTMYPDASGIILLDDGEFALKANGTNSYRYHFQGLILKEEKKAEWGGRSLHFDDKRERAKVLWARTILPGGRTVNLDPATIKITEPAGSGPFFHKGKILSYTLPQVDVGCVVEYCYEVEEFDPFDKKMWFPGFYFQGVEPVAVSRLRITVPRAQYLNYRVRDFPQGREAPTVTHKHDTTTYQWELRDIPPLIPEPRMPPESAVVPRVHACLFKTWDYIFDWMARLQERRIEVTPEVRKTVMKITAGAKGPEEKVARLYHFIERNIRYISIKGSIGSGWSGHPAFFTLKNRYGDCIDKAILFTSMLKAIGVQAEPVILLTNNAGEDDRTLPSMRGNHAITHLRLNGRDMYLDATSSVHRYPSFSAFDHGVLVINALRREIGRIPLPRPEENTRRYELVMHIAQTGDTDVRYTSRYDGSYEAGVRAFYMYSREADHERRLSNWISSISPKAKLKSYRLENTYDISKPFSIHLNYSLEDYVVSAGALRILGIPGHEMKFPEVSLPKRKYDIVYPTSIQRIYSVTVTVPGSYKVKYLPPPIHLRNDYASYDAEFISKSQTTILFRDRFRRPKRRVPVKDYALYKKLLQRISKYMKKQMFFEVQ